MKLKPEFNLLVLVGAWNKNIFNPEWVGKFLLPEKELEVEFPVNLDGSPRISTEDVRIFVLNNKLNFSLRKTDDYILEDIEELALKISEYLPHTPVVSFGINFVFECDKEYPQLEELFLTSDLEKIRELQGIISSTEIKRSFIYSDKKINLIISKNNENYLFNFNFHFDIGNLLEFREKLNNNKILDIKNIAIFILNNVYGVQ